MLGEQLVELSPQKVRKRQGQRHGYTLTRARVACGGQEELDQALQTGEVRQVTEDGTTYYVFKARRVFFPFRPLLYFLLLCRRCK